VRLSELIGSIPVKQITGASGKDPVIGSIHYRCQAVTPGGLFVAIPGHAADGHDFIDTAFSHGAAAVIAQRPVRSPGVVVTVEDSRKALSAVAAAFYGHPSATLCTVGITGTNGKTTTAYLIESILTAAGRRVGVIGTINYRYGGKTFQNPVTTPESLDLQRILAEMRTAGMTHAVMEVSSHGIDLSRIAHCLFDLGVFTNLSQDHLDYHGTMDAYRGCKQRLFTEYLPQKPGARAVINADDRLGRELIEKRVVPVLTFGRDPENDIRAETPRQDLDGISATLITPGAKLRFRSLLVGAHNIENILAAAGTGVSLGVAPETIRQGIEALTAVPGRLERIPNAIGRSVFVDYAHTPDALENVLKALKAISSGRIICIFGCGGDRDRKKRPLMGKIAGVYADLAIVTSDNPRSEPPLAIIEQIRQGLIRKSPHAYTPGDLCAGFSAKGHLIEADRKKAIFQGIFVSAPGDAVIIAGKGHETYQIVGKETLPFDDRAVAQAALTHCAENRWDRTWGVNHA